jgi:hypothetical protein
MTGTLGIGAGVKAITHKGVKHEQKTTAAGRSCHCRTDRRLRFVQFCRKQQDQVDRVVVGAGDAALEGVVAVDGVVVGAGDAALEGLFGVEEGVVVGAGGAAAAVKGSLPWAFSAREFPDAT